MNDKNLTKHGLTNEIKLAWQWPTSYQWNVYTNWVVQHQTYPARLTGQFSFVNTDKQYHRYKNEI